MPRTRVKRERLRYTDLCAIYKDCVAGIARAVVGLVCIFSHTIAPRHVIPNIEKAVLPSHASWVLVRLTDEGIEKLTRQFLEQPGFSTQLDTLCLWACGNLTDKVFPVLVLIFRRLVSSIGIS